MLRFAARCFVALLFLALGSARAVQTPVPCAAAVAAPAEHAFFQEVDRRFEAVGRLAKGLPHLNIATLVKIDTSQVLAKAAKSGGIRVQQQVDDERAKQQAMSSRPIVVSAAERNRALEGSACREAFAKLKQTFSEQRAAMGYPDEATLGLGSFGPWYMEATLNASQKQAADLVIDAERRFGDECLSTEVPIDMPADEIKRAVGILSYGDEVFCSALRLDPATILTARHCLVSPANGVPTVQTQQAMSGRGHMWFSYEGEPERKFEVCRQSLPSGPGEELEPSRDHVTLTIAPTATAAPHVAWYTGTLNSGESLYLRGYFLFADSTEALPKMRATRHGGCIVTAQHDRCVFHACQTLPVMSGAPIFRRPDTGRPANGLEVVAIHLGPASMGTSRFCQVDGNDFDLSNFGYRP